MPKLNLKPKKTHQKVRSLVSLDPIVVEQTKRYCLKNKVSFSFLIECLLQNHLEIHSKNS